MTPKKKQIKVVEEPAVVASTTDPRGYTEAEPVPAPEPTRPRGFYAYAAFDFDGEHYEPGSLFTPPASLKRDGDFDQFRGITKRAGGDVGIAFYETLPPLTPKGEPYTKRHVLPLEEA